VPILREIKTLGGYIVKIETSVAELKITLNGVIRTFPKKRKKKRKKKKKEVSFKPLTESKQNQDNVLVPFLFVWLSFLFSFLFAFCFYLSTHCSGRLTHLVVDGSLTALLVLIF
jgi:hypothetical protein